MEQIQYRDLSLMVPNPKNPRDWKGKTDAEKQKELQNLADSIRKNPDFFEARPILLSDRTGVLMIIGGERRWEAARHLGLTEAPSYLFHNLTEEREDEIMNRDNAHSGVWDEAKLQSWNKEQLQSWGVDLPKWKEPKPEVKEDGFNEKKAAKAKQRCKFGDLWKLGNHRLLCGDSTKEADIELLIGGGQTDLCFTSPPYNAGSNELGGNKNMKESKYIHNDSNKFYFDLLKSVTQNSIKSCKYVFVNLQMLQSNKRDIIRYLELFKDKFCDVMIWDKLHTQPAMAKNVLNSRFEFVFIFGGNGTRAINLRDFRGTIDNVYTNKQQHNNEFKEIHAATFPLHLPFYFIDNFCPEDGSILDPFGGTGTTMIAAEQLNRSCYMLEIEPMYCDAIIDRWEQFTGKKAEKIN